MKREYFLLSGGKVVDEGTMEYLMHESPFTGTISKSNYRVTNVDTPLPCSEQVKLLRGYDYGAL